MKKILPLIFVLFVYTNSFAQFDERWFMQLGGTLGADVTQSSGVIGIGSYATDFSNLQINYASLVFTGRLNFLELSNNSSFSLSTHPTFSIGRAYNDIGGGGNMWFRVPGFIEMNFGAGSTVSTRKDVGFGMGFGIQYTKYPIFNSVPVAEYTRQNNYAMKTNWVSPALQMGIRFFGKSYYCREINLRASYVNKSVLDNRIDDMGIVDFQSVGVMISFLQYLNY